MDLLRGYRSVLGMEGRGYGSVLGVEGRGMGLYGVWGEGEGGMDGGKGV